MVADRGLQNGRADFPIEESVPGPYWWTSLPTTAGTSTSIELDITETVSQIDVDRK